VSLFFTISASISAVLLGSAAPVCLAVVAPGGLRTSFFAETGVVALDLGFGAAAVAAPGTEEGVADFVATLVTCALALRAGGVATEDERDADRGASATRMRATPVVTSRTSEWRATWPPGTRPEDDARPCGGGGGGGAAAGAGGGGYCM